MKELEMASRKLNISKDEVAQRLQKPDVIFGNTGIVVAKRWDPRLNRWRKFRAMDFGEVINI